MSDFTQSHRPVRVTTALGPDAIFITGMRGHEAISELFSFELDLVAPVDSPIDFSKILGQPALVEVDHQAGVTRFFHGIISRFSQGRRDPRFAQYRAELVPLLWVLTRREQSRIFQHQSAKEILAAVFDTIPLKWATTGDYAERDYCTQYRESDYDFAQRLMEEEGIFYYFEHTAEGHTLVLADSPQGHADVPQPTKIVFRQGKDDAHPEGFAIASWEKSQEIRTGKFTLWDHNFEMPDKHLDAEKEIAAAVTVGTVSHNLQVGPTAQLENYTYPGGYADWFDGIDRSGGEQASDLEKVFEQNVRLVGLRAQRESSAALRIIGTSDCANLTSGLKFAIEEHFDADGEYVLTSVRHEIDVGGGFVSGDRSEIAYSNKFQCLPAALAFRPERTTARPAVWGTQTAIVVGPAGKELFTDKYGRVKVQFHWDRDGKNDADSSCWIRVATTWAGKGWGVIHIPRIGHEVVVDFLEGDPDRPIIIGSVYNADHMPPGKLPDDAMISGLTSRSTPNAGPANFNGMRANDTKDKEHLTIQAEFDQTSLVKHDEDHTVGNDRTVHVTNNHAETVDVDQAVTIGSNQKVDVGADQTETVGANRSITIATNDTLKVAGAGKTGIDGTWTFDATGNAKHTFGAAYEESVGADRTTTVGGADKLTVSGALTIDATGKIIISSFAGIEIHCRSSSIKITPDGIEISGSKVDVTGSGPVTVKGAVVKVNS